MISMKPAAAAGLAAVLSVALAACGGSPANEGPPDTAESLADVSAFNPQPYENLRDGGTLTTSLAELSPQMNVWQNDRTLYTRYVWNWYNPLLITFTADGDAVYNPDYLTDVKPETVDGNTRVTYTINPKATYNDGTPIDWTSFEAGWRVANGKDPAYLPDSTDGYDRITSVTPGVDDRQAVVTFDGINLWWQGLFNNLIHPRAAADPTVFNQGYVNTPHAEWGAGPYTIQNFDPQNGAVVFERNPKWWGKPGKLDTRTFLQMDSVAAVNAFRNGQLDAVAVNGKDQLAQITGVPDTEIRKGPTLQLDFFTLNGQSPVLADPQVRKAIFEAIDRKQIAEFHFQGLNYTADPVGSMNLLPFQKGYSDTLGKVIRYDPEQAERDLDAAGWTVGADGIREKDGQPLRISYVNTGDDAVGKAVSGGTAAMLKNVGVQVDIRQVPTSDYSKIVTGRQFDMFYSGISQSDPYGVAYICQLYCSDSELFRSGVNDPKNDPLIRSVNTLPTPEEQYAKANEAETAAFSTYGVMPTVNLVGIYGVKNGLANTGATRFFSTPPENIGWQKQG
ncbi:ABC transporter family substrate-binding protein [Pseudonocardia sp. DLS-67]